MNSEIALDLIATFWIGFLIGVIIGYVCGKQPQPRNERGQFCKR